MKDDLEKIPTGILGLDSLLYGGIWKNTASVIVGSSGTGKTLFCLQYLLEGLHRGENALYLTLEESPSQLIKEAKLIGFKEFENYVAEEKMIFVHSTGSNLKKFISESLPRMILKYRSISARKRFRIAIDPLTPLIWALPTKAVQRELIHALFAQMKSIGTVVATVEDHSSLSGDFRIGSEVTIPVFLSDYTFVFQFLGLGNEYDRGLVISKSRGSNHVYGRFPVDIVKGWGLIVVAPVEQTTLSEDTEMAFDQAIELIKAWKGAQTQLFIERFKDFKENWKQRRSPAELINIILKTYNIF